MQVEVTDADRELFVATYKPDSSTAESVMRGMSYTWEVVAWLRSLSEEENGHMPGTLANWIEAKMHEV